MGCCCCPDEAQLSRASGENREPGLKWAKWRRSRVKAAQQPNSHDLLLFSVLLLLVRLMLLLPMWLCFFPHIRIVLTICFLFFFFCVLHFVFSATVFCVSRRFAKLFQKCIFLAAQMCVSNWLSYAHEVPFIIIVATGSFLPVCHCLHFSHCTACIQFVWFFFWPPGAYYALFD